MENIDLNSPYKIIQSKQKRYGEHYGIPAAECIITPVKRYDDQLLCDVLWKNASGQIQIRPGLMFTMAYLEPLDALKDFALFTTWEGYSNKEVSTS